jgi:hypothetical protein
MDLTGEERLQGLNCSGLHAYWKNGTGSEPTSWCRLDMAASFRAIHDERQALDEGTDLDTLPVCLTDDGLANGSLNMLAVRAPTITCCRASVLLQGVLGGWSGTRSA